MQNGTALFIIDMQNDFLLSGRPLCVDGAMQTVTSGVRIGTPAVTTRGMKEAEMAEIGGMIVRLIKEGESAISEVKDQVVSLCERFPLYPDM